MYISNCLFCTGDAAKVCKEYLKLQVHIWWSVVITVNGIIYRALMYQMRFYIMKVYPGSVAFMNNCSYLYLSIQHDCLYSMIFFRGLCFFYHQPNNIHLQVSKCFKLWIMFGQVDQNIQKNYLRILVQDHFFQKLLQKFWSPLV